MVQGNWAGMFGQCVLCFERDSLFSRDVSFWNGCALHFGHLNVALDLVEIQAKVLSADRHQCTTFPRPSQWGDLHRNHDTARLQTTIIKALIQTDNNMCASHPSAISSVGTSQQQLGAESVTLLSFLSAPVRDLVQHGNWTSLCQSYKASNECAFQWIMMSCKPSWALPIVEKNTISSDYL